MREPYVYAVVSADQPEQVFFGDMDLALKFAREIPGSKVLVASICLTLEEARRIGTSRVQIPVD